MAISERYNQSLMKAIKRMHRVLELIGSYVRKDTVTKVLRILEWAGSIALAAVMVFWLYRQGFCAREYISHVRFAGRRGPVLHG